MPWFYFKFSKIWLISETILPSFLSSGQVTSDTQDRFYLVSSSSLSKCRELIKNSPISLGIIHSCGSGFQMADASSLADAEVVIDSNSIIDDAEFRIFINHYVNNFELILLDLSNVRFRMNNAFS